MRPAAKDRSLHFEKVMNFLNRDRKHYKRFCNKTLCSQGENFAIHDGVVASMSDYFNALLGGEMQEKYENIINIDKIPPKRLGSVIDYIYTGDIELTEENVLEVLEDADYTQMTDLKLFCGRAILQTISANNCLKMRAHACRYNLADVEAKTNQTILDNIAVIVQQTDFMILDADDVSDILKQTKNIEAAFNGMVSWVNFNPSHREDLFVNLFSQLDLSLFSTQFLATVKNENLVRKNVETCSAVLDAAFNRFAGTSFLSSENHGSSAILIIGGLQSPRDCVKYDVTTKQSKMLPKLNSDKIYSTSATVRNKIYVMGGGSATNSCEMMDLETNNQWKSFANMLQPRQSAASTVVQEQIYVTGGFGGTSSCSSCLCYNVNEDIWRNSFSLLQQRGGHGACSIERTVYCIGGLDGQKRLSSCERHDLRTGTSLKISPLQQARSSFPCVAREGLIYAIGGCDSRQTVEVYEPRADKWRNVSPLLKAREYHSACVVEGRIYVVGGWRLPASRSVEVYDAISDEWTEAFILNMEANCSTVVAV